jgi:tetratricopeptide (TPR) repeat protein
MQAYKSLRDQDDDFYDDFVKLGRQYHTKHYAKKNILRSRKIDLKVIAADIAEELPVNVEDVPSYVHFPADKKDIRALLKEMPQGLTDGLQSISLCLGKQDQQRTVSSRDEDCIKDPYTERVSYEVFEKVFGPPILGTFFCYHSTIRLYAYVYDPAIQNRDVIDLYLKLHMLGTFVHELAHHYDRAHRVAQDRWMMNHVLKSENYAEVMAHDWIKDYVIPYIEKAYPSELKRLRRWMKEKIGLPLDLTLLAGDHRITTKKGYIFFRAFFNTSSFFEEFVRDIQTNKDVLTARIDLARGLHYADQFQAALKIIDSVFKEDPQNKDALCLYADIHVCLGNYKEAITCAKKVLRSGHNELNAISILCHAFKELGQWLDLLKWAKKGASKAQNRWRKGLFLVAQTRALIELELLEEAKATLAEIKVLFKSSRRLPRIIQELETEIKKKIGKQA